MTTTQPVPAQLKSRPVLAWAGLLAMMMTSFALVTAEFLPGSLLTDLARDLQISEGLAGQTVTVTALVGFVVAPTIALMFPRLDRRKLLVALALTAALSNVLVAVLPSFPLILMARFLLGAALSGFWAMSLSVAAKIAGPEHVGRAMMVVNSGTTLATVAGVPLGVLLSNAMSWQSVFVVVAGVTVLAAVLLWLFVPSVPATEGVSFKTLGDTLRRPGVTQGLIGHVLVIAGHIIAYTFIRLSFERVDDGSGETVALLLLLFGVGGFVGNLVLGMLADRYLGLLRLLVPLMTATSIAIVITFTSIPALMVGAVLWGAGFGGWLVVLNTWLARIIPDRLEAGAGLAVAGFQLAIATGAGIGGLLVDSVGVVPAFYTAVGIVSVGAALFSTGRMAPRGASAQA